MVQRPLGVECKVDRVSGEPESLAPAHPSLELGSLGDQVCLCLALPATPPFLFSLFVFLSVCLSVCYGPTFSPASLLAPSTNPLLEPEDAVWGLDLAGSEKSFADPWSIFD